MDHATPPDNEIKESCGPESGTVGAPPLTIWSEVGRNVVRKGLAIPFRVWILAKATDHAKGGSGWVQVNDLVEAASPYGLDRRHIIRALKAGDELFWEVVDHERVRLVSYEKIAAHMGCKPGRIVEIPGWTLRKKGLFTAHLYAAWMGRKQISRARLMDLFGVTKPTLRKWEKIAGVNCATTTVQIHKPDFQNLLYSAFHGQSNVANLTSSVFKRAWYECKKCMFKSQSRELAEKHEHYTDVLVVTQLPNLYSSPLLPVWRSGTGRGTLRKVRRAHHAAKSREPQGAGEIITAPTPWGVPHRKVGDQGQRRYLKRTGSLSAAVRTVRKERIPVLAFSRWIAMERRYEYVAFIG